MGEQVHSPLPTTKTCNICGIEQFRGEFHSNGRGGIRAYCRTCDKKYHEPIRMARRCTPERREKLNAYYREKEPSEAYKARRDRHLKKRALVYPEKRAANYAVSYAIKTGRLVRPDVCDACHQSPGKNRAGVSLIQAHHPDYSKPLEVSWLCLKCHVAKHATDLVDGEARLRAFLSSSTGGADV